jgi:hypothetical protein
LVSHLPDEKQAGHHEVGTQYQKWVPLACLDDRYTGEMVVEGLRAKTIPAVLYSTAGHTGFFGLMSSDILNPMGHGYYIMVPLEFIEDADREGELMMGDSWHACRIEKTR